MATTALVVLVPEADPIIGNAREQHTAGGRRGMRSHVTVLAPFADTHELDDKTDAELRGVISRIAPFEFKLACVEQFDAGVLYLAIDPVEPFRELTARVCATFPDYQPYGGEFAPGEVEPHCTVAVSEQFPNGLTQADEALFTRAEAEVAPSLPITCRATSVAVMADESAGWKLVSLVPFGP